MLELYRTLFLIDRDDFEQIAVQSPIPVSYFRENYPMAVSFHCQLDKPRDYHRATFFIAHFYLLGYNSIHAEKNTR